jgi:hypothetical protein
MIVRMRKRRQSEKRGDSIAISLFGCMYGDGDTRSRAVLVYKSQESQEHSISGTGCGLFASYCSYRYFKRSHVPLKVSLLRIP